MFCSRTEPIYYSTLAIHWQSGISMSSLTSHLMGKFLSKRSRSARTEPIYYSTLAIHWQSGISMSSLTSHLMGKFLSKRSRSARSARSSPADGKATSNGDAAFGDSRIRDDVLQHSDAVTSVVAVRPGLCLSGSKDQSIVLYDYSTRKPLERWIGHSDSITKVCYGCQRNDIVSASRDKTVKLWRTGNSNWVKEYTGHSLVVTAIHLNSDNTQLCSGSRDNSVKLWDVETATCIKTNTIAQNLVTDVKFVPRSSCIVQTGEDKEVRVLDSRILQPVFSFPKKQYIQTCCDVSPDGHYVVSASNGFTGNGCEGSLWDMRTRKLCLEYRGHTEAVESCLFLPGTQTKALLATASRDRSVKIWSQETGVCECEFLADGAGPLTSLAACQDGTILVGSFNRGVQVLKLRGKSLTQVCNF